MIIFPVQFAIILCGIHNFYVEHGLLDEQKAEPGKRFTANGMIYSYARNEVWQVGDVGGIVF